MCYICRKTITDYSHFNDETRGGKNGQCTLFDRTEDRHQEEVENAKKAAIATILTEHPEFKDVDLDITQTAAEKEDRERRLRRDPLHMDYQRLMAEAGVAVPGGDNLLGYPIYQRLYGVVGGVLPGIPPPAPRPGVPRAAGAPEPPEAPRPGIAQLRPVVGGAGPAIGGGGQPNVPIAQLHNHIFPAPNPPLMRHPHRLRADGPRVPAFAAFVEEEDLAIVEGARLAPFQVEVGVRLQERLNRLERRYFGDRDLDPRIRFAVDRRAEPLPLRDPLGAAEVIDNGLPDRRGRLRDLVHARLRGLPQQRNLLGHPQDDDPGDVPDPI